CCLWLTEYTVCTVEKSLLLWRVPVNHKCKYICECVCVCLSSAILQTVFKVLFNLNLNK
uniref:Uncharacterized protein n=1 Tax=Cyprinus carpio carpio TaxID=630221 RepID=A0A9J7Y8I0_CYPCA